MASVGFDRPWHRLLQLCLRKNIAIPSTPVSVTPYFPDRDNMAASVSV